METPKDLFINEVAGTANWRLQKADQIVWLPKSWRTWRVHSEIDQSRREFI